MDGGLIPQILVVSLAKMTRRGKFYLRPSILDLTAEIAPRGLRGGPAVSQKSGAAAPWERLAGVGRFRDSEHEKEKGLHRAEEKLMADSPRALARTGRERNARFTVRKKISLGEIQSAMHETVRVASGGQYAKGSLRGGAATL